MEYRDTYKGHVINAWTSTERPGRFIWSYTIDDESVINNEGRPMPLEQLMLDEAIGQARAKIDSYPK